MKFLLSTLDLDGHVACLHPITLEINVFLPIRWGFLQKLFVENEANLPVAIQNIFLLDDLFILLVLLTSCGLDYLSQDN